MPGTALNSLENQPLQKHYYLTIIITTTLQKKKLKQISLQYHTADKDGVRINTYTGVAILKIMLFEKHVIEKVLQPKQ